MVGIETDTERRKKKVGVQNLMSSIDYAAYARGKVASWFYRLLRMRDTLVNCAVDPIFLSGAVQINTVVDPEMQRDFPATENSGVFQRFEFGPLSKVRGVTTQREGRTQRAVVRVVREARSRRGGIGTGGSSRGRETCRGSQPHSASRCHL